MPVYALPEELVFPDPRLAEEDGLLAVGGDLSARRLLLAYAHGIFPWYNSDEQPVLWFSPDPRFVLRTADLHIPRSLAKRIRRGDYVITVDQAFSEVIAACRTTARPGQGGTWITPDMERAYTTLHRLGFAHSVEAWQQGVLVGGLYGVAIGRSFSGESMFAHAPDASKVAFVWLVRQLHAWGWPLIDCQMETDHLARFGAVALEREDFLAQTASLVRQVVPPEPWSFSTGFHPLPTR